MLSSKCAVCNRKKIKFYEKATSYYYRLLRNLARVKIPILSDLPSINTLFLKT